MIRKHEPGFLIVDLMLPGKAGLTICREVRQFSNLPIIMLTARVDEIDRLLGLELSYRDITLMSAWSVIEPLIPTLKTCVESLLNPPMRMS